MPNLAWRNNNSRPLTAEEVDDNFEMLSVSLTAWVENYGADPTGVRNSSLAIQTAIDVVAAAGGGVVRMGVGDFLIDTKLVLKDHVHLCGSGLASTRLIEGVGLGAEDPMMENTNFSTSVPDPASPGIRLSDFAIVGTARQSPAYLSKADGTPITDPEADYRVGGALAPTSFATLSLTLSGGEITGVSIVTPGSGYVSRPVIWVTGDGYGGRISANISAGAVSSVGIISPGVGYTTASLEVAGGGADPVTALFAADRRNPDYATMPVSIRLSKAINPTIERVAFHECSGNAITNRGCANLMVQNCQFFDGGQPDFVGSCIWSGAYGSIGNAPYRKATDTTFRNNYISNHKRSVTTIGCTRFLAEGNVVEGWGESCWFGSDLAVDAIIRNNRCTGGRVTDIVCSFMEADGTILVDGNHIEDCDGVYITFSQYGGARVTDNVLIAPETRNRVVPFGPFSERITFQVGEQPVAGAQRSINDDLAVRLQDVDTDPGNSPQAFTVRGNQFRHGDTGSFIYAVGFSGGALASMGDVIIRDNDITFAPGCELYDAESAAEYLMPTSRLIVDGNIGPGASASHMRRVDVALNQADATGAQPWFPGDTGVTLRPKTTYRFMGRMHQLSGVGAHDFSLSFGGTAVISTIRYRVAVRVGAKNAAVAAASSAHIDVTTAIVVSAAASGSRKWVEVEGVFETDTAGTFIPNFAFSTTLGSTPQIETDSYFKVEQIGIAGMTASGWE